MRKMRKFRDYLMETLADREEAIVHLEVALEEYQKDGDTFLLRMAFQSVVEAQGGLDEFAQRINTDPQDLLKVLSGNDKPDLDTIEAILNGLGCRLSVIEIGTEPLNWEYTEILNRLAPMIDCLNPHLNLVNTSVTVESLNHLVPAMD